MIGIAAYPFSDVRNGQLLDLLEFRIQLCDEVVGLYLRGDGVEEGYFLPEDVDVDIDVLLAYFDVVKHFFNLRGEQFVVPDQHE